MPERSENMFVFFLQRYANLAMVAFPHWTRVLTLESDGALVLRDEQFNRLHEVTEAGVSRHLVEAVSDSAPWEAIQRDR
jgi:hypothetical protein